MTPVIVELFSNDQIQIGIKYLVETVGYGACNHAFSVTSQRTSTTKTLSFLSSIAVSVA